MSNIQDNTIFSPSVFSPGILGRTGVFETYLLDKRNGVGVLDQYGGASAAYSLYDLGNRRGSVVETEATYSNPAVRLRRDSDNTHKSFPAGAFTQMQNWANEDVDWFSESFDGASTFSGSRLNSSSEANGDPPDSNTDWVKCACDAVLGTHAYRDNSLPSGNFIAGNQYRVTCQVYVPAGQTNCDGAALFVGGVAEDSGTRIFRGDLNPELLGTVVDIDYIFTAAGTNNDFQILAQDGATGTFAGADDGVDDLFYARNILIQQLTSNAYATTWYDQSGVSVTSTPEQSDFESGVDGYTASSATITGAYDSGDANHSTALRVEADATTFSRAIKSFTINADEPLRYRFDYKAVSGSDGRFRVGGTVVENLTESTWTTIEGIYTPSSAETSISFLANYTGGATSDELLIDNVRVEVLDKAHNDATQTTADSQPKVVSAGALVVDANGNVALDFDGVDDSLVVVNLVNEFENTDFQLTAVGSNVYAGLVSGSVPRLYFRDTAYSYDALSIITYTNPALAIQTWECVGSAHEVFHDGSSVGTATQAQTAFGPTDFAVGQSAAAYRDTNISALLFYASDQSANRSAIEQSLSNTITTALS